MSKFKAFFQNIYVKIISLYLGAIFIVFSIIIAFNMQATRAVIEKNNNSAYNNLMFYANTLEADVLKILGIQNLIFADNDIIEFINMYYDLSQYDRINLEKKSREIIAKYTTLTPLINDITVYAPALNIIIPSTKHIELFENFESSEAQNKLFAIRDKEFFIERKYRKIFCSVQFENSIIDKLFAKIKASFPSAEIAFICDDMVVRKTDNFIYNDDIAYIAKRSSETETIINEGKTSYFSYSFVRNRLSLVVKYPRIDYEITMIGTKSLLLISILLVVVLSIIFSVYTSYIVKYPMAKLTRLMKQVEQGNLDVEVIYDKENEFKYIFSGFKNMMTSLKKYIQMNYEQQIEINKSEIRQLQSQINPHFLYNCFFNLSKLCKIEDSHTAMILSQKLAAYYMYITRNKNDEVTLEAEYQHAKAYLDIQQIRFGERVSILYEEPSEECKSLIVPKIVLQPILENSFKYVFDNIEQNGIIKLSTDFKNKVLSIFIEDNGCFATDEMIDELNRKIKNNRDFESTGIINVHRRLNLRNPLDGVEVKRSQLGGISVQLTIHYMKEEK